MPAPLHIVVSVETIFLVFSSVGALAALVIAVISLRRARRATALPDQVLEMVNSFAAEMEGYRSKVVTWRTEIDNVLLNVETVLDSVEKKRRSTAASETRQKNPPAPPESEVPVADPMHMSRYELEILARQRGLI